MPIVRRISWLRIHLRCYVALCVRQNFIHNNALAVFVLKMYCAVCAVINFWHLIQQRILCFWLSISQTVACWDWTFFFFFFLLLAIGFPASPCRHVYWFHCSFSALLSLPQPSPAESLSYWFLIVWADYRAVWTVFLQKIEWEYIKNLLDESAKLYLSTFSEQIHHAVFVC